MAIYAFFFFFQAEDGIRDLTVTAVQTCALPISLGLARRGRRTIRTITAIAHLTVPHRERRAVAAVTLHRIALAHRRSEERRVGKSVDLGGRRIIKKKKQQEHT